MSEAIENTQDENVGLRATSLWGQVAQQVRKDVTNGFSYDPELVAAILKSDIENIKQVENGVRDQDNELSFRQYDFLVRKYGLKVLNDPLLFAAMLANEEIENE